MNIDKQNIITLTASQATLYHSLVLDFLRKNIGDVLDYGLMDDILFQEYEANVNLLTKPDISKVELDAAFGTLATILYSLMHSANEQIEEGVPYPIFSKFIQFTKENFLLICGAANPSHPA